MTEKKFKFDPEHTFLTSDSHFGHLGIIKLCNRPFKDVADMTERLIENWNSVVSESDTVFHLGDFAFGGNDVWRNIISRLNGQIYLILGNHDRKNMGKGTTDMFVDIVSQMQIDIEGQSIYLNHYPFLCYGGTYREKDAVWQAFGHVHTQEGSTGLDVNRMQYLFPTQYDVGVDNNNYTPVSYLQFKNIITKQIENAKTK